MEEKKKLYIVEDDGNIRRELQSYLAAAGYQVTAAEDFSNVAAQVLAAQPNLVLLDMNLPGISGLHICEQIREKSQVPVIFVTGNNTSMDELNCLLRGGDDFVSKPYQLPVLMARIAAVLRRTAGPGRTEACQSEYKGVTLDLAAGKILRGDCVQELTRNELKILHCLWKHPGEIVSRADLIDELWDHEVFIDDEYPQCEYNPGSGITEGNRGGGFYRDKARAGVPDLRDSGRTGRNYAFRRLSEK